MAAAPCPAQTAETLLFLRTSVPCPAVISPALADKLNHQGFWSPLSLCTPLRLSQVTAGTLLSPFTAPCSRASFTRRQHKGLHESLRNKSAFEAGC